jgi:hypothetical protein
MADARSMVLCCPMTASDHDHRTRQNVLALTLLAVIAFAAWLLFSNFLHDIAITKCATAGRQDCSERVVAAPSL